MKTRTILTLSLIVAASMHADAQVVETNSAYPTGYIAMDRAEANPMTVEGGALYVGNALVKVERTAEPQTFTVPNWVIRICPGAFSDANISTLRLPVSWTESTLRALPVFISPQAFDHSNIQKFEIYNDNATTAVSSVKSESKRGRAEVYDTAGRLLSHRTNGVNIVRQEDGSVVKVAR